jgi:hypothetical protein
MIVIKPDVSEAKQSDDGIDHTFVSAGVLSIQHCKTDTKVQ